MTGKSDILQMDTKLLGAVVLLALIGILGIFSSGFDPITKVNNGIYLKQLLYFCIGLLFMGAIFHVGHDQIGEFSLIIYSIILVVVIATSFLGSTIRGFHAWIRLGFVSIQPSEFMKLSTVILLAKYLEIREREMRSLRELVIPILITFVPVLFILMQSDTGSTFIFIPILFSMLFAGGADTTHLFSALAIVLISLLVPTIITYHEWIVGGADNTVISFFKKGSLSFAISGVLLLMSGIAYILHVFIIRKYFRRIYIPSMVLSLGMFFSVIITRVLKDYQKKRLLVFLDPDLDPHGAGYNAIQSKIAIGSGGLFGKGFLHGTQTQLGFLPERSTDFIFSVISEEWGFVGATVVLMLYAVIIYRGIRIALLSRDKFSALVATGITSIFLCHILINIGMTIGIMPVTGIPLCFLSYGGSNLVMSMIGVGILLHIDMKTRIV